MKRRESEEPKALTQVALAGVQLDESYFAHLGFEDRAHGPSPAKELLAGAANTNIDEIARATGFSSASHFASFIRRMTGRTPRQLRG